LSVVPILIAFGFIIFIFYLRKRESVHLQKQAELKQQVAEIEMKALRAQINPHFVFNCMNAIYKSIGLNEIEKAGGYLIKFATLMRLILENSRSKEVSLSDDLKAMELYVQMEQFRMGRSFTFTITIDETIHKDNVLIPPMILQPFIENSIWHGFHQINYEPELLLNISRENDQLCLLLRDNGQPSVESPIAPELSSAKKSSLGLILTKERVDLLSKTKGGEASVEISDIRNLKDEYAGKQVLIKIPYDDAS
jgi:LytS/YehU family sensor histidine kinase